MSAERSDRPVAVTVTVSPELRTRAANSWQDIAMREQRMSDRIAADFFIRFATFTALPDDPVEWDHGDGDVRLTEHGWSLTTTAYVPADQTEEIARLYGELMGAGSGGDQAGAKLRLDGALCDFLVDHLAAGGLAGNVDPVYARTTDDPPVTTKPAQPPAGQPRHSWDPQAPLQG